MMKEYEITLFGKDKNDEQNLDIDEIVEFLNRGK